MSQTCIILKNAYLVVANRSKAFLEEGRCSCALLWLDYLVKEARIDCCSRYVSSVAAVSTESVDEVAIVFLLDDGWWQWFAQVYCIRENRAMIIWRERNVIRDFASS